MAPPESTLPPVPIPPVAAPPDEALLPPVPEPPAAMLEESFLPPAPVFFDSELLDVPPFPDLPVVVRARVEPPVLVVVESFGSAPPEESASLPPESVPPSLTEPPASCVLFELFALLLDFPPLAEVASELLLRPPRLTVLSELSEPPLVLSPPELGAWVEFEPLPDDDVQLGRPQPARLNASRMPSRRFCSNAMFPPLRRSRAPLSCGE